MKVNPNNRKPFYRSRCRADGCRVRTRQVYSFVVSDGLTVRVHLCEAHHAIEREHGSQAITLKPVVAPEQRRKEAAVLLATMLRGLPDA